MADSKLTVADMQCLYLPPAATPAPGVVIIHEGSGFSDDIVGIAHRFAERGYAVAAPDLFSGAAPRPLCIARTMRDVFLGNVAARATRIAEVGDWLGAQPGVDATRIGVVGFCMGGRFALAAATTGKFAVAGANYAQVSADVEELRGACPVVASYGGLDKYVGDHGQRLERQLDTLGVPHDIKTYPNVGHSFMNHTQLDVQALTALPVPVKVPLPPAPLLHTGYRPAEADDAFGRLFAFFDRWLGADA